jgi:hypothetical protein
MSIKFDIKTKCQGMKLKKKTKLVKDSRPNTLQLKE